ncbi:polysaccharide biosynthesis protein [Glaciecola punicea]|nr:polysaccharide biosynthesis protein [Glaciecola punicea]
MIYTLSSILSAAIPFLLLPVLTRYLSPEEYGQIAMFMILTGALAAVIGLSAHGAANRRFFDNDVSNFELARFNGNCFFILLASSSIILLVIAFLDNTLSNYLGIPVYWVYLAIISVNCSFVMNLRLGQWQIRGKAKSFGIFQVSNSLIALSFSLLLVVVLLLGPEGRIYAIVITSAFVGLVSFYTLRNDNLVCFKYNRQDIREALFFGVPLIPHVLGAFLLSSIDRLVINKELGLEVTGIYMVAVSLGGGLNVIFSSVNRAFSPWLFEQLKADNLEKKITIVKKTYIFFLCMFLLSILVFFIAPPILRLVVGERFHQAAEVLPIILLGQIFLGMYFIVTNYIFYVRKTKYLSYVTISCGAINVVLLLLLIPNYGITGAAVAFLIANICQFIFTWMLSSRVYAMPWAIWRA